MGTGSSRDCRWSGSFASTPPHGRRHARGPAGRGAGAKRLAAAREAAAPDLAGVDLSGLDLRGVDFRRANLTGARLADAKLGGANLFSCDLTDAVATGADLTEANLDGTVLRRADFRKANLEGASLFATIIEAGRPERGQPVGHPDHRLSPRRQAGGRQAPERQHRRRPRQPVDGRHARHVRRAPTSAAPTSPAPISTRPISLTPISTGAKLQRRQPENAELVQTDFSRADLTGARLAQANIEGATSPAPSAWPASRASTRPATVTRQSSMRNELRPAGSCCLAVLALVACGGGERPPASPMRPRRRLRRCRRLPAASWPT